LGWHQVNFDINPSKITDIEKGQIIQSLFNSDALIDLSKKELVTVQPILY